MLNPFDIRRPGGKRRNSRAGLSGLLLRVGKMASGGILAAGLLFPLATVLPAAAVDPIRIGATVSLSGKYAEPSRMVSAGYRLWADQVNAQGGLFHRPVELILKDDRSREDLVRQHYHTLIEEIGVDLVLSPYGSPLTLAASEVSDPNGYVMMAAAASADILFTSGFSETERVREAESLGISGYLKKPFTIWDLGQALKTLSNLNQASP
mgnify:FL=1